MNNFITMIGAILTACILIATFMFWQLFPEVNKITAVYSSIFAFNAFICELLILLLLKVLLPHQKILNRLMSLVFVIFAGVHFSQFFSLYNSFDYLTSEILGHSSLAWQLVNVFSVSALLFFVAIYFILNIVLQRKLQNTTAKEKTSLCFSIIVIYIFLINGSAYTGWFKNIQKSYRIVPVFPLAALAKEMVAPKIAESKLNSPMMLTTQELASAQSVGITIDQGAQFPLLKDKIYDSTLLIDEQKHLHNKPNVIVFFVESLSARFFASYGSPYKDLTPQIDKFAEESSQITSYYNHAFPTVNGLRGQLCSIFPYFSNAHYNEVNIRYKSKTQYRCLPHILNEHQYETTYLSYAHPNETFFEAQMQEIGFSKAYYFEDFLQNFLKGETPERPLYGNSDRQMFQGLMNYLQGKEKNRTQPFFVSVSTIETHPGLDVLNPQFVYKNMPNPALNSMRNFDYHFGQFWQEFKKSALSKNTIVILTGDHVRGADVDFRKIAGDDYQNQLLDKMALWIYSPFHQLPKSIDVHTTSIDFAPSVLHLLNVSQSKNHFLGLSFFGERQKNIGGLGLVYGTHYIRVTPEKTVQQSFATQKECEQQNQNVNAIDCHLYRTMLYTQDLLRGNKLFGQD